MPENTAPIMLVGGGRAVFDVAAYRGVDCAALSNGKMLVLGQGSGTAVYRLNADGTLDKTFGANGVLATASQYDGKKLTVLADGKFLIASTADQGNGDTDLAVTRYNANGSVDVMFGTNGTVTTTFNTTPGQNEPRSDFMADMVVQPDGKIVVAGTVWPHGATGPDAGLVRYTQNGALDTGFGDGGIRTVNFADFDNVSDLALASNGSLVITGSISETSLNENTRRIAVARVDVNGDLDITFGDQGVAITPLGKLAIADQSVVLTGGKVLTLGYDLQDSSDSSQTGSHLVLLRYDVNGALDPTFGSGGVARPLPNFVGETFRVLADGKILITGWVNLDNAGGIVGVVRLNANGTLDATFGVNGLAQNDLSFSHDFAFSTIVQADGKIVVCGYMDNGNTFGADFEYELAVTRFNANGTVDATFGAPHFTPGGPPVVLDHTAAILDFDLYVAGNFGGSTLTLARAGGAVSTDVFSGSGALGALTQSGAIVVSGTIIGVVTKNSGGQLVLTFNNNATSELLQDAIRAIAYSNNSGGGLATINWTFSDGNTGGAQGTGGAKSVSGVSYVVNEGTAGDHAPSGADATKTLAWNATHTFAVSQFAFSDVDGDAFAGIKINTVPAAGTGSLTLNGVAVTVGQNVSAADIAAGKLKFTPGVETNASFTFQVRDSSGSLDSTPNAFAFNRDGNDSMTGGAGADTLKSGGGNDTLNGAAGADTMVGGTGHDLYYVDNPGDRITEAANAGTDQVRSSISYTLADNVENLTLTGSAVSATGNGLNNALVGTNAANTLNGGAGADTMTGAGGDDTYYVDSSGDVVVEAANGGADTVRSSVSHTLAANVETLVLTGSATSGTGNALNNRIDGTNGANTLNGAAGADTMTGLGGDDLYYVDASGDVVIEAANGGVDSVRASLSYALAANVEKLTLTGSAVSGIGNTLANTIVGTAGGNYLDGGLGNDTLTGGAGGDRFTFSTALGTSNIDTITDFEAVGNVDFIRLENAVFVGLPTGALAASAFVVGSKAADGLDRIIYNQNTGALYFDRDGSGSTYKAVQFVTLDDHLAMTAGDFVVI